MTQGFIDTVLFNQETTALLSKADEIRKEIEVLKNSTSTETELLLQAEELLRFTEKSKMLEAFDEALFTRLELPQSQPAKCESGHSLPC